MMINTTNNDGIYIILPQEVERRSKKYRSILRKSKLVPITIKNSGNMLSNTVKSTPYELLAEAQPYGGLSSNNLLWFNASIHDISVAKKRLISSLKLGNTASILISMKQITPLTNKKANPNRRFLVAA
jgi:hypothetical protein